MAVTEYSAEKIMAARALMLSGLVGKRSVLHDPQFELFWQLFESEKADAARYKWERYSGKWKHIYPCTTAASTGVVTSTKGDEQRGKGNEGAGRGDDDGKPVMAEEPLIAQDFTPVSHDFPLVTQVLPFISLTLSLIALLLALVRLLL